MGSFLVGIEFQFCKIKRILETRSTTMLSVFNATELYFKMIKMVNFMFNLPQLKIKYIHIEYLKSSPNLISTRT